jgi:hypothetical protein
LLTEGFLTNVKSGLPRDNVKPPVKAPSSEFEPRPSTSIRTFIEGGNVDTSGKKPKKDKNKKESSRPSMKEIWDSYKDTSNAWYSAPYKRAAAEDQRAAYHIRDGRPSLDIHSSSISPPGLSPQPSIDRSFSMSSASANSGRFAAADKEKKRKKTGFMKNMFAGPNAWYGHA